MTLSKVSCFYVQAFWWGCFKGVSSLSNMFLARHIDNVLEDITGLVGICLLSEPDYSWEYISNEKSEYEDSDKIIVV